MIVPSIKVAKIYKMLEIDTTIISNYIIYNQKKMKKNNNLFSSTYQPKNKLIRSSLKVINYTDEELISLYKDLSKRINYERLNKINIKKEIITSSKKTYKYYFPKEIGGPVDYLGSTILYYELNK